MLDLGSMVGADKGFWNQPGVDKTRRYGPSGPATVAPTMGAQGLAQDLSTFAGGGTSAPPRPAGSTTPLTAMAHGVRPAAKQGKRHMMQGGGGMMGAPSIQSLSALTGGFGKGGY